MNTPIRIRACRARRQRGALIIAFMLMLTSLLGLIGLSFDLGQVYNRRTELQNVADSAALAAAAALDGSTTGIDSAAGEAKKAAEWHKYAYVQSVTWNDAAITFSSAPDSADADWRDKDSAKAGAVASMLFVKVDTRLLAAEQGLVSTAFMRLLSASLASVTTYGRAVAGRSAIQVTPLGICALRATARDKRPSSVGDELVEYGFRRGVGYNLLNLSPVGPTPLHYLVDPLDAAATGTANFATSVVAPFICSGTMAMPRLPLPPATVHVQAPFPTILSEQLNSRFNVYGSGPDACNPVTAPPSTNVKLYLPGGPVWWQIPPPSSPPSQTAAPDVSADHVGTKADPGASAPDAASYGLLWSYATAVKYAATEPVDGYVPFTKANWAVLYPVAPGKTPPQVNAAYPASLPYPAKPKTPYISAISGGSFFSAPTGHTGQRQRRLLNIPLLSCPDASGTNTTATVLAIGKFFMTAQATATSVSGEFAGVVAQETLGAAVRLYQ